MLKWNSICLWTMILSERNLRSPLVRCHCKGQLRPKILSMSYRKKCFNKKYYFNHQKLFFPYNLWIYVELTNTKLYCQKCVNNAIVLITFQIALHFRTNIKVIPVRIRVVGGTSELKVFHRLIKTILKWVTSISQGASQFPKSQEVPKRGCIDTGAEYSSRICARG